MAPLKRGQVVDLRICAALSSLLILLFINQSAKAEDVTRGETPGFAAVGGDTAVDARPSGKDSDQVSNNDPPGGSKDDTDTTSKSADGESEAKVKESSVVPPVIPAAGLEEVNRQILLQEIALEKHSINFRHYHNIQGRWKGWRYFATQEANNVLTGTGLAIALAERARIVRHPYILSTARVTITDRKTGLKHVELRPTGVLQRTRRSVLESAVYPQLVGQCLAMSGSALEFGINTYHRMQTEKLGIGCKQSLKQVKSYRENLDSLFARRDKLLAESNLSGEDAAEAKAEGVVLRDTAALSLKEYEDFHVNTRRYRTLQDTLYVFDIARNATGVAGNIVNLVGYHEGSAYLTGPASVMTTVSGAIGILTPLVSRGYAKFIGDSHRRLIQREVGACPVCTPADYDLDRKNLQILMEAKKERGVAFSHKATAVLDAYEGSAWERRQQFKLAQRDQRAGVRAAQENIVVGGINGITKVTMGVTGVISGYGLTTANHRGNDVMIPGTITYLAGTWLSAGENIRLRIVDEVNRHKLGKQGLLPGQVLAARLKKLDQLEKNLKAVQ